MASVVSRAGGGGEQEKAFLGSGKGEEGRDINCYSS